MKFDINTLKRATCAVIAACVLLLGTWTTTQAQRRSRDASNGYPNNYYGQRRRAENRTWRERRHVIQRHQRLERSAMRDRWRANRDDYDNNRSWRDRRKSERKALKLHQRTERQIFKERFKNRRKGY